MPGMVRVTIVAMGLFVLGCSSSSGGGNGDGGIGSGGSVGSGGSGGIDCNTSCGYLTTCCPGLPMSECLEGCQTNPSQSPSCQACFDDTTCGALDPCVIANCGLPQDVCYGGAS
jgi:hypothetical protein